MQGSLLLVLFALAAFAEAGKGWGNWGGHHGHHSSSSEEERNRTRVCPVTPENPNTCPNGLVVIEGPCPQVPTLELDLDRGKSWHVYQCNGTVDLEICRYCVMPKNWTRHHYEGQQGHHWGGHGLDAFDFADDDLDLDLKLLNVKSADDRKKGHGHGWGNWGNHGHHSGGHSGGKKHKKKECCPLPPPTEKCTFTCNLVQPVDPLADSSSESCSKEVQFTCKGCAPFTFPTNP